MRRLATIITSGMNTATAAVLLTNAEMHGDGAHDHHQRREVAAPKAHHQLADDRRGAGLLQAGAEDEHRADGHRRRVAEAGDALGRRHQPERQQYAEHQQGDEIDRVLLRDEERHRAGQDRQSPESPRTAWARVYRITQAAVASPPRARNDLASAAGAHAHPCDHGRRARRDVLAKDPTFHHPVPRPAGRSGDPARLPVPVIVHLSGRRRGTTQRLIGESLRVGVAVDAEVRVSPEPSVAPYHATLQRTTTGGFELNAAAESPVWVNGEPVQRRPLASGDVLEIGRDGPLLRYRVYPPGTRTSQSVAEAFADGVDGARFRKRSSPARAALGAAGALRELAFRAPLWFRLGVMLLLAALVISTVLLVRRGRQLEERLALGDPAPRRSLRAIRPGGPATDRRRAGDHARRTGHRARARRGPRGAQRRRGSHRRRGGALGGSAPGQLRVRRSSQRRRRCASSASTPTAGRCATGPASRSSASAATGRRWRSSLPAPPFSSAAMGCC